jgi:hypothetical protein
MDGILRLTDISPQIYLVPFATQACHFRVVGLGRVELPTSPLSGVRSNQLSYRPVPDVLSSSQYTNQRGQYLRPMYLTTVPQN